MNLSKLSAARPPHAPPIFGLQLPAARAFAPHALLLRSQLPGEWTDRPLLNRATPRVRPESTLVRSGLHWREGTSGHLSDPT